MISRIFCLTLEKDFSRREEFTKSFERFGIPIIFHFGIDGRNNEITIPSWLENIELHKCFNDDVRRTIGVLNKELTDAEKACAIGHLGIWNEIAQLEENQFYLVCEDDSIPKKPNEFIQQLNSIKSEINDTDFVYCGYLTSNEGVRKSTIFHLFWHWLKRKQWSPNLYSKVQYNSSVNSSPRRVLNKNHIQKAGMHWGAFGYLLTPKIARELLALNCQIKMTSDGTLRYARLCELIPMYIAKNGIIIVNKEHPSNLRSVSEHENNFNIFDFG
jgi:GR25 family glycosyltransferase involved in LPS biosynthesis